MNIKKIVRTNLFILASTLLSLSVLLETAEFAFASKVVSNQYQLLAQAFSDDRCPDQYVYLLGYTKNYNVIICGQRGTGKPTHYLGVSRKNDSSILLTLRAYTDTRFFARNGQYTYNLDLKTQTLTIRIPGRQPLVERFTVETP